MGDMGDRPDFMDSDVPIFISRDSEGNTGDDTPSLGYTKLANDYYDTLSEYKGKKEEEISNTKKEENNNNRKAEYENEESHVVSLFGYFIGILYYIMVAIVLIIFVYDKMYKSFFSTIWMIFLLFLPYLLYSYLVPFIAIIFDFILNKIIPKNVYYDIK